MKRIAILAVALAIGGPVPAHAQTSAQWSQLVAYVGKLANRMLEQQTEIERLKATLNTTIGALEQERCRTNRLQASLRAAIESSTPITWVDNVACFDLKSPVPPFPEPLP